MHLVCLKHQERSNISPIRDQLHYSMITPVGHSNISAWVMTEQSPVARLISMAAYHSFPKTTENLFYVPALNTVLPHSTLREYYRHEVLVKIWNPVEYHTDPMKTVEKGSQTKYEYAASFAPAELIHAYTLAYINP